MSKLKTQLGVAQQSDFQKQTWTFKMPKSFSVTAGTFAIIPQDKYDNLLKTLREIASIETPAFGLKGFDGARLKSEINNVLSEIQ